MSSITGVLIFAVLTVLAVLIFKFSKSKKTSIPALTEEERTLRGLSKTRTFLQNSFDKIFGGSEGAAFFDDLEETLITADIGVEFAEKITTKLRKETGLKIPARLELKSKLTEILTTDLPIANLKNSRRQPNVILIVGVNGAGKTTTIAKLCSRFRTQEKTVLVGAADTFRAAAIDQLKTWVERTGAQAIFQKEGSDPSAVAFDTVSAAVARKVDVCLIDTAGRLHTKHNLMEELAKMKRVVGKALPGAPHDVWLVLDGSTGQNACNQAREFHQHLGLTGLIVTKLDGTAKGGAILATSSELKIPIYFIGVGEALEDLVPFDGPRFVEQLLGGL